MFNARGANRGPGSRGGMGFGFRGSSPPWPYVGRGRGGLPRCGYFLSGTAGTAATWPYQQPAFAPQASQEQELAALSDQAQMVKEQLAQIESRIRELEAQKK
ncbi:MAG: DUF5320 domain-containing protein [Dehalococcoidales bacterium]